MARQDGASMGKDARRECMTQPIIGLTCHRSHGHVVSPTIGPIMISAVNQHYIEALDAAGGVPVCIPVGLQPEAVRRIYGLLDGLLLPGGGDVAPERYGHERHQNLGAIDEARDELEVSLCTWALQDGLPILGICRGIQVMAVAAGGTLYQDLPSELGSEVGHNVREYGRDYLSHHIQVREGSLLCSAIGCALTHVNSFHHQAVREVPPGFAVSATAPDGVIEAMESVTHPFALGVQCHPEGIWQSTATNFAGLFEAFVEAASNRSAETVTALRSAPAAKDVLFDPDRLPTGQGDVA